MTTFEMRRGTSGPPIHSYLSDDRIGTRAASAVAGVTLRLRLAHSAPGADADYEFSASASAGNLDDGLVVYFDWTDTAASALPEAGDYLADWLVEWSDEEQQAFPSRVFNQVRVT